MRNLTCLATAAIVLALCTAAAHTTARAENTSMHQTKRPAESSDFAQTSASATVFATPFLRAQSGKAEQLSARLQSIQRATRAEEGNLAYDIFRAVKTPDTFIVIEAWRDTGALQRHIKTPLITDFVGRESHETLQGGRFDAIVLRPMDDLVFDTLRPTGKTNAADRAKRVYAQAILLAKEGKAEALLDQLRAIRKGTRGEPGNLGYNIYRSADNPLQFVIFQGFVDQAAFDQHVKEPHIATFTAQLHETLAKTDYDWFLLKAIGETMYDEPTTSRGAGQ